MNLTRITSYAARTVILCLAFIGLTNCEALESELPKLVEDSVLLSNHTNQVFRGMDSYLSRKDSMPPDSTGAGSNGIIGDLMDPVVSLPGLKLESEASLQATSTEHRK